MTSFLFSILLQFTDGYFNENLQSTIGEYFGMQQWIYSCSHLFIWNCIGVDFKVKVMEVASPDGKLKRVKVTIWDTGLSLLPS